MTEKQAHLVADRINDTYRGASATPCMTTYREYGVTVRNYVGVSYGKLIPALDTFNHVCDAYDAWPWEYDGTINRDGDN